MKEISFTLRIDEQRHTVEFTETRRRSGCPICKAYADGPAELGEVCRAAAAYFLEAAFLYETSMDFCPPPFTNAQREAQVTALLQEHKNIFEEGENI